MAYDMMKREKRRCLECGHQIQYGRSDKKFCCDTCKNRWHNRGGNQYLKVHSKIIHILDVNYKILSQCLANGQTSIDLGDAIQWGFQPDYLTGIRKNRLKVENRCFDIKYCRSENRIYRIEKISDFLTDSGKKPHPPVE